MKAEEVKPYSERGSKGEQVEEMFDSIAPAYDFMNNAMTFGLHKRWLEKALAAAKEEREKREGGGESNIIDLATGTGEVAFRLSEMFPNARITGVDLSEGMLEIARKKEGERREKGKSHGDIEFVQGDCMNLNYPDGAFDLLTIAYGVRNFEDLEKGFTEFFRVLKKGGVCMILELSRPENRVVRLGYDIYSRGLIPLAGRIVSRDSRAYTYLPESIAAMPPRPRLAVMLEKAGFVNVKYKSLTLGVVTYYIAIK